jgi:hypothetical protein
MTFQIVAITIGTESVAIITNRNVGPETHFNAQVEKADLV